MKFTRLKTRRVNVVLTRNLQGDQYGIVAWPAGSKMRQHDKGWWIGEDRTCPVKSWLAREWKTEYGALPRRGSKQTVALEMLT